MGSAPSRKSKEKSENSSDSEEEYDEQEVNKIVVPKSAPKKKLLRTRQSKNVPNRLTSTEEDFRDKFLTLEAVFKRIAAITDPDSNELMVYLEHAGLFTSIDRNAEGELRSKWIASLSDYGFVNWWLTIWQTFWTESFMDNNIPEWSTRNVNFQYIIRIMWGATDDPQMCKNFTEGRGIEMILKQLQISLEGNEEYIKKSPRVRYYLSGMLAILHNVLRHFADAKRPFRLADGSSVVAPYSKNKFSNLKARSIMILAHACHEADQQHLMVTSELNLKYILSLLEKTFETKDHRYKSFSAEELLEALNKLAANDLNKVRLVKRGALPLYTRFLKDNANEKEVFLAANGLWALSFPEENKLKIKIEPGCVDLLEELKYHRNTSISESAEGVLWTVSLALVKFRRSLAREREEPVSEERTRSGKFGIWNSRKFSNPAGHIMISYNWSHKPVVLKIREGLKQAGYKVWIDVENMSGSLLEAMADAIEKASLVIVCLSESYRESPSCRTEAEYIYRLQKPIIPIRNEADFIAEGWLGALVGSQLYFDCVTEETVDLTMPKILREVQQKLQTIPESSLLASPLLVAPASQTDSPAKWSSQRVEKWLIETGLPQDVVCKFDGFNGRKLLALQCMYQKAPASFYNCLTSEFGMKLCDLLGLQDALETL